MFLSTKLLPHTDPQFFIISFTQKFVFFPREQYHRKKKNPALPLTEERLTKNYPGESLTSIYQGIPQSIDPRAVAEPSLPENWQNPQSDVRTPYHPTEAVLVADETRSDPVRNKRNYKGRYVKEKQNVRMTRPHIIDTRNMPIKVTMPKGNEVEDKNVFVNPKKVETGIKIKLIPEQDKSKKRIVLKNPK